jgi:hypothetical protein
MKWQKLLRSGYRMFCRFDILIQQKSEYLFCVKLCQYVKKDSNEYS